MRCDKCAHWEAPDAEREDWPLGRCKRIVHDEKIKDEVEYEGSRYGEDGYTEAVHAWRLRLRGRYLEAGATVADGSGYYAELNTAPGFGCILFEEKS